MCGTIKFESEKNVGTTFMVQLPFLISADMKQAESQEDDVSIEGMRILLAEDNELNMEIAEFYLSDRGAMIEKAWNGQEALDKFTSSAPNTYDIILMDIMMPVMDGKKMCQIVKSQMETSHIPIILLTALGDKEHILEGLEIKADQYLVKPFDVHILKATIHTLIENRKMLRNRFKSAVTALPEEAPAVELPTSLDDEFIQKVTELVKEGLGKNFNVDTLCASVNMSRTSFYNKIKALTGIAPAEFIRNIRMQEAALMLKSQRYTVAEVSDKMGFADPKYFTDTFKKFYGVPPSIYMKKN